MQCTDCYKVKYLWNALCNKLMASLGQIDVRSIPLKLRILYHLFAKTAKKIMCSKHTTFKQCF